MRLMVQSLLIDRFQLQTAIETRDMPIYRLRLNGDMQTLGPQMRRTLEDCDAVQAERRKNGENPPSRPSTGTARPRCTTWVSGRPTPTGVAVRYQTSGTDSGEFAEWLSPYVGRIVVDATGLRGGFDIDLVFAPPAGPSPAANIDDVASVFAALRDQLGLTLEADRGPVRLLVITSARRPTPD
jgi:uncharacterized protein (TIGR03435 family)